MTLRQRNPKSVGGMLQRFRSETEAFIKEAIEISYWSRSAVSYHAVYDMTPVERDQWRSWLRDRLETEGKKPYPSY